MVARTLNVPLGNETVLFAETLAPVREKLAPRPGATVAMEVVPASVKVPLAVNDWFAAVAPVSRGAVKATLPCTVSPPVP